MEMPAAPRTRPGAPTCTRSSNASSQKKCPQILLYYPTYNYAIDSIVPRRAARAAPDTQRPLSDHRPLVRRDSPYHRERKVPERTALQLARKRKQKKNLTRFSPNAPGRIGTHLRLR